MPSLLAAFSRARAAIPLIALRRAKPREKFIASHQECSVDADCAVESVGCAELEGAYCAARFRSAARRQNLPPGRSCDETSPTATRAIPARAAARGSCLPA